MRRSKYPNFGILDVIEKFVSGGITRESLLSSIRKHNPDFSPKLFSHQLHSLKTRGVIHRTQSGKFILGAKGREYLSLKSLTEISLRNKKTDGYNRLIIFDIPEKLRHARNVLRVKLKEFECKQLQRSVYITPYVCEDEMREVARILRISSYVHILKVVPF